MMSEQYNLHKHSTALTYSIKAVILDQFPAFSSEVCSALIIGSHGRESVTQRPSSY